MHRHSTYIPASEPWDIIPPTHTHGEQHMSRSSEKRRSRNDLVSEREARDKLTEWTVYRLKKADITPLPHEASSDRLADEQRPSWDRIRLFQVTGLASKDIRRRVRDLDKETGPVDAKMGDLPDTIRRHLEQTVDQMKRAHADDPRYRFTLAQIEQELRPLDPSEAAAEEEERARDKSRGRDADRKHARSRDARSRGRSRGKSSSRRSKSKHKKLVERVSVTAYIKKTPRSDQDVVSMYLSSASARSHNSQSRSQASASSPRHQHINDHFAQQEAAIGMVRMASGRRHREPLTVQTGLQPPQPSRSAPFAAPATPSVYSSSAYASSSRGSHHGGPTGSATGIPVTPGYYSYPDAFDGQSKTPSTARSLASSDDWFTASDAAEYTPQSSYAGSAPSTSERGRKPKRSVFRSRSPSRHRPPPDYYMNNNKNERHQGNDVVGTSGRSVETRERHATFDLRDDDNEDGRRGRSRHRETDNQDSDTITVSEEAPRSQRHQQKQQQQQQQQQQSSPTLEMVRRRVVTPRQAASGDYDRLEREISAQLGRLHVQEEQRRILPQSGQSVRSGGDTRRPKSESFSRRADDDIFFMEEHGDESRGRGRFAYGGGESKRESRMY